MEKGNGLLRKKGESPFFSITYDENMKLILALTLATCAATAHAQQIDWDAALGNTQTEEQWRAQADQQLSRTQYLEEKQQAVWNKQIDDEVRRQECRMPYPIRKDCV
jgi:hypothetical protein